MKLTFVHTFFIKGIQGVSKIKDGYNPATWMLEVTSSAKEMEINFAEVYKSSELYRYFLFCEVLNLEKNSR
jgi:hypothetical protein